MSNIPRVIRGANIKIYLNDRVYNESQSVSYSIDYGEAEIYGIDSHYPQEISSTRYSVQGSIQGVRVSNSAGIQAYDGRPQAADIVKAQYVSIRIQDRQSGEDILFIPSAKISSQSVQVSAKGVLKLSFNFKGLAAFEPLDRI